MFDTMTLTKVTGSVCGALLIYLFGAWAADGL
jgi:cytochrome c